MIKEIFIDEFVDPESDKIMKKTMGYLNEGNAILIEESGHIIIVDEKYIHELQKHRIPKEIENKLKSRMFIKDNDIYQSETVTCGLEIKPEFFMVDLTKKCNMHCKYCLRNVSDTYECITSKKMLDICDFIADYCMKYNIKDITIQPWGGEPLIELDKILLMKKKLTGLKTHVHFSIETNALLLNKATIKTLYENKIGIGISIDGYKQLHDSQRIYENGLGTHSIVEKNLLLTKQKYGDRVGIITTITKNNASHVEEILEYYAVELGLKTVKFNYVHESMFTECKDMCLAMDEIAETELRLLRKLIKLNERGYEITEHNISVKLRNILLKRYSDICHSCGCSGGRKMIVFDMDGNIYPCELTDMPNEKIGSIYDKKDLIDIIKENIKYKDFFFAKKAKKCNDCLWYVFCKGGCTVRAISVGKRPPEIDEIECAVNTTLYPELMKLIVSKPKIVNALVGEKVVD